MPEDWRIIYQPLPKGRRGSCNWQTKTITIDTSLTPAQKKFALTHETLHAIRGPVAPYNRGKEEAFINRLAAKILIPIHQLAEAVESATSIWETAELLNVDAEAVRLRLQNLSDSEKKQLEKGKQNEQHQETVL